MAVPGINGCSFHYDSLHVLELGVASHILANIMFDLVIKSELPGGSQEMRLKELFKRILQQYQELGIDSSNQIRRLTLSTFCKPQAKYDSFPELSGIKAKEVRYLISPLVQLCKDLGGGQPYQQHRVECISHLEKMYDIMDSQGLHPDLAAYKKYKKNTEMCLLHYSKLAKIAMSENLLQWNTVHKHHLSCHMVEQFRYLNCKYVATYTGETMVGFMSSLGHACLNGTKPHLVPATVAWRYRLGMHLRCTHGDFDVGGPEEDD